MTVHKHQFFAIPAAITKPAMTNVARQIWGVAIVCGECGHVRHCFEDGTLIEKPYDKAR